MADIISKEDILKVALLSNVIVYEEEIATFQDQLDALLAYVACVREVGTYVPQRELVIDMNRNVSRPDVIHQQDKEVVLRQVPVREGSLIIVPMILEGV